MDNTSIFIGRFALPFVVIGIVFGISLFLVKKFLKGKKFEKTFTAAAVPLCVAASVLWDVIANGAKNFSAQTVYSGLLAASLAGIVDVLLRKTASGKLKLDGEIMLLVADLLKTLTDDQNIIAEIALSVAEKALYTKGTDANAIKNILRIHNLTFDAHADEIAEKIARIVNRAND